MTEDKPTPSKEQAKPKRTLLDWILVGATGVVVLVFVPLGLAGVMKWQRVLGSYMISIGVLHLFNSIARMLVPRWRRKYIKSHLIIFLSTGIVLTLTGILHILVKPWF